MHGIKGDLIICPDCMDDSIKFINLFTGDNAMQVNEVNLLLKDPKKNLFTNHNFFFQKKVKENGR